MDLARCRISDRLFEQALERDAEARPAFIEGGCGDDEELERFVLRLVELAESSAEGSLLETASRSGPPNHLARELVEDYRARTAVPIGAKIGPYRVLREIGRGGMGVVYQGERSGGHFDQTVALKLPRRGMESPAAIDQFERERQILAALAHPNIAHLLDGGITSDGLPYFAMEYVEGSCIDEHCDEHRLSLDERIRLFLFAARAVDFANSRLIAHGDIKPSNLRVTSTGEVMLLDFGIARLLPADDHPAATRPLTRILTPEYASPEQVLGKPFAVASDVYQLGLLLYELLTGRRAQPVRDSTPAAFERAVCLEEPPNPSTRWSDEEAERHARARSTTPAVARRRLRGDLDNIVTQALFKEPERRYRSVGQLIADIERFQNRRRVLARPDSCVYRASRFVARHRMGAAAVGCIAALLISLGLTVAFQLHRLERERDQIRLEGVQATRVEDVRRHALTAENPSLSELPRPTVTDLTGGYGPRHSLEPVARPAGPDGAALGEAGDLQEARSLRRGDPEAARWLHLADELLRVHVLPSHPDPSLVARLLDLSQRSSGRSGPPPHHRSSAGSVRRADMDPQRRPPSHGRVVIHTGFP